MSDPHWQVLKKTEVPARPKQGYWTLSIEYVNPSQRLKFVVEEVTPAAGQPASAPTWSYASERKCTADGDPKAPFNPAVCLFTDAPPGALIAKIGGSTAGRADGAKVFVVGSYCVFELDEKTKGPLFLTMNSDPMSSLEKTGSLQVTISQSV
jgi:hypothetical protein